jgi:chromosome partitioning protein
MRRMDGHRSLIFASFLKGERVIVAIVSPKGGVGKTTSAVHLASYLQERGPTLLVDGDENRSSVGWSKRGALPFRVCAETQTAKFAPEATHIVIDTAARPPAAEIEELLETADRLVVCCTPDALSLHSVLPFGELLRGLAPDRFRILLTMVPTVGHDGEDARALLAGAGLPLFAGVIRRAVAFQKSALAGTTVNCVKDDRAAAAWADYVRIGEELLP